MAADKEGNEYIKKRPTSAPRAGELTANIPKIVLVDKTDGLSGTTKTELSPHLSSVPANLATVDIRVNEEYSQTTSAGSGQDLANGRGLNPSSLSAAAEQSRFSSKKSDHPPIRSSSDIGLPAASMPNLALQLGMVGGGAMEGGKENHLGVYCSPRTSRRSVDLDINSRADTHGQYEWIETLDSSSNSLKVLTASSRVGSALSLNSECTARSIGLLSNDSDSDNDVSISEKDKLSDKPAQLRRFMSHPEEGTSPEVGARPSQSLCNLKSANASKSVDTDVIADADLDTMASSLDNTTSSLDDFQISVSPDSKIPEQGSGTDTRRRNSVPVKTSNPPSQSASKPLKDSSIPTSGGNSRDRNATRRSKQPRPGSDARDGGPIFSLPGGDASTSGSSSIGGGQGRSSQMLCYRCDQNDTSRDGRIRQWLQDMDKHSYSNG
ncbi:uncharacterized protein LOC101860197 [Aplysia californica]|uniref:Uncharacterized protein LOC101860197 n=1 Tax=Aplysia californica TaxID=6500 RepID=A0ABM1VZT9_APLCA|nr:uncharacterized protein LOC101860197 [Aplysia californica]XP_005106987.1 uncharacterized protein LOC101860197 [Aplysia californica]XP_035827931.1 uncharacterized protein LOC101860197 [Aplysia californica]XP_035827932.1 uncharacterized protein LOC101860197 [Aplysia californica]